jgi:hypothetical protein
VPRSGTTQLVLPNYKTEYLQCVCGTAQSIPREVAEVGAAKAFIRSISHIDATDSTVDMETSDVDLALRYTRTDSATHGWKPKVCKNLNPSAGCISTMRTSLLRRN